MKEIAVRIPINHKPKKETGAQVEETIHHHSATGAPAEPISEAAAVGGQVPSHATDTAFGGNSPSRHSSRDAVESDPTVYAEGVDGVAAPAGGRDTKPQDAERESDLNAERREAEEEMWGKQAGGEVETQTKDLEPNAAVTDGETGSDTQDLNEIVAEEIGETGTALAEAKANLLHLAADFENFKRQAARREKEARERASERIIEDLLPVLDNLERALDAAANARDVESVRVGVDFIAQQFREVLRGYGVEVIEAQGKAFDPAHHEALEEISGTEHAAGTVAHEVQRGYKLHGRVLRPSRVRVAGSG